MPGPGEAAAPAPCPPSADAARRTHASSTRSSLCLGTTPPDPDPVPTGHRATALPLHLGRSCARRRSCPGPAAHACYYWPAGTHLVPCSTWQPGAWFLTTVHAALGLRPVTVRTSLRGVRTGRTLVGLVPSARACPLLRSFAPLAAIAVFCTVTPRRRRSCRTDGGLTRSGGHRGTAFPLLG